MAKYCDEVAGVFNLAPWRNVTNVSLRWKDICLLGLLKSDSGADWCRDIMVRKLSNGGSTKF
jgi:hypothetical protein